MALPFQIQIGRVSRFLSKWASTKGSSPIIMMGSEITPVVALWSGVENRFLDSWNRFGGCYTQSALAAQNSGIRFRNPAGSNSIVVFEKLTFSNLSGILDAPFLEMATTNVDLTPFVLTGIRLDARVSQAASIMTISHGNTVAAGGNIISQIVIHGGTNAAIPPVNYEMITTDNQEISLLPGDALTFRTGSVNTVPAVGAIWRERSLEESERQ